MLLLPSPWTPAPQPESSETWGLLRAESSVGKNIGHPRWQAMPSRKFRRMQELEKAWAEEHKPELPKIPELEAQTTAGIQ